MFQSILFVSCVYVFREWELVMLFKKHFDMYVEEKLSCIKNRLAVEFLSLVKEGI